MNKYKIKIVSVLLFAFTFFLLHDYALELPNDIVHEKSCSIENVSGHLAQLHDNIHSIFETSVSIIESIEIASLNTKPNTKEISLTSYISFVPQKPPLV